MAELLKPDFCVIGAGSAGLTFARAAAVLGKTVVLIERGAVGRRPALAAAVLRAAARHRQGIHAAGAFGIAAGEVRLNWTALMAQVERTVANLRGEDSPERLAGLGIRLIKGSAAFRDRRTVVAADVEVRARRFVVAAGAQPALPAVPGLDGGVYLTPDNLLTLRDLPRALVVIGGGASGVEWTQIFARLGSKVTLIDAAVPLADVDPEAAGVVLAALEREGVTIHSNTNILSIVHAQGEVRVTLSTGEALEATHVLVATGRKPDIDGLALDAAGVKTDASGIVVNRKLRTSNRNVFAIGDVVSGQPRSVHAGEHQATLVIRNELYHSSVRAETDAIPRVLYTDPGIAQLGMSEAQARGHRCALRIARQPFADCDLAQAENSIHGHVKIVARANGSIMGVTIVGPDAAQQIVPWMFMLQAGHNADRMATVALPSETFTKVSKRAVVDLIMSKLTRSLFERIMAALRISG